MIIIINNKTKNHFFRKFQELCLMEPQEQSNQPQHFDQYQPIDQDLEPEVDQEFDPEGQGETEEDRMFAERKDYRDSVISHYSSANHNFDIDFRMDQRATIIKHQDSDSEIDSPRLSGTGNSKIKKYKSYDQLNKIADGEPKEKPQVSLSTSIQIFWFGFSFQLIKLVTPKMKGQKPKKAPKDSEAMLKLEAEIEKWKKSFEEQKEANEKLQKELEKVVFMINQTNSKYLKRLMQHELQDRI